MMSQSAEERIARDLNLTLREAYSVRQAFEHLVLLSDPRSEASLGFHTLCVMHARNLMRNAAGEEAERRRWMLEGGADQAARIPELLANLVGSLTDYMTHPIQEEATNHENP